ncbi:MAG: penicillin-binding protein 2 [Planctomycetota bacterium]
MSQKRIVVIIIILCIPFILIELQLFGLQVINGSYYRNQAQKQSTRIEQLPASRGKIFDRNGNLLAYNEAFFDLYVTLAKFDISPSAKTPARPESPEQVIRRLARVTGQKQETIRSKINGIEQKIGKMTEGKTPREKRNIIRQYRNTKYRLVNGVNLDIALEVESNPELFPGISVAEGIRRVYPAKTSAAHILGYLGSIWEKEYSDFIGQNYFRQIVHPQVDDGIYEILVNRGDFKDDSVGRAGIEKYYNLSLTGQAGVKLTETDYLYKQRQELSRITPRHGEDVTLTIEKNLQISIEQALKNKIGAAIVMDINNGEILALASAPNYDPNKLLSPVSAETVQYVFNSPSRPLYNRAVSGEYALGSVFKVITGLAALEEGKITQHTSFFCNGYFLKSSKHFKCWISDYNREHGNLDIQEGLTQSCNVFFFNAGKLAGPDAILKWAKLFGFGQTTGIDLPGESKGLMPDPAMGSERGNRKWGTADTLNISIGQGDLMVTPLQVVRMMAAVANGGTLVTPHVTRNLSTNQATSKINISQKNLSIIRSGLYSVVNSEHGTAHGKGLDGFSICGKTSTAQAGNGKNHGWFAGFGPNPKPQLAFVVVLEHGGKGSEAAAPVAAEFMANALACISRQKDKK